MSIKHFTICGDITEETVANFYAFCEKLQPEQSVCLNLSSTGGNPDAALAIVGIMKACKKVTWHAQAFGYLYSAAVLIFACAEVRRFSSYGFAMVHEAKEKVNAEASGMLRYAKHMQRYEQHWNAILASKTSTPESVWEKMSEKTTYLNAEECLKLGLCTEII
jgi:ATP-dependent protease ClpP protease subunit